MILFGFKYNQSSLNLSSILRYLLIITPVFMLSFKHWINLSVVIIFLYSLSYLYKKEFFTLNSYKLLFDRKYVCLTFFMFVFPLVSVGIGQILRYDLYLPNFDAPLRLFLCGFIFIAICNGCFNENKNKLISIYWLRYILPISLIFIFLFRPAWSDQWGNYLITTYFVDPLSFGQICLFFTLITILSLYISLTQKHINYFYIIFLIFSLMIGLFLAASSGSRTGWVGLPIILTLYSIYFKNNFTRKLYSYILIILIIILSLYFIYVNKFLYNKIFAFFNEVINYKWYMPNKEGSADLRISIFRMGLFYFLERPLQGWGDLGWKVAINSIEISQYTSEAARLIPEKGFHNEILTNSVRSGVFGLLSSVMIFLMPFIISIKFIFNEKNKKIGIFLLTFIVHQFIAGLSTEVTHLIYLSSFFGLTLALLIGEGFYNAK